MLKKIIFLFLLGVLSAHTLQAQQNPEGYSLARYSVIWENSLFGYHTKGQAVPFNTQSWALSGVYTYKGGHGAVIVSKSNGDLQQIETGVYNESGFTLKSVVGLDKSEPLRVEVENDGYSFWVERAEKRSKKELTSTIHGKKEISSTKLVFGNQ